MSLAHLVVVLQVVVVLLLQAVVVVVLQGMAQLKLQCECCFAFYLPFLRS
jgi:hypothetical protein